MFYPVQSIRYTLQVTRTLWLDAKKQSVIGAHLTLMLGVGVLSWISWVFSLPFGILCALLTWISVIDLYDRIIPDILLVGTCFTLWWLYSVPDFIISSIVILIILLSKVSLEKIYKKSLVGWGDIKLMAICIIFIPINSVPAFFMLSGGCALFASLVLRKSYLPFGPFIIIGLLYILSDFL